MTPVWRAVQPATSDHVCASLNVAAGDVDDVFSGWFQVYGAFVLCTCYILSQSENIIRIAYPCAATRRPTK